MKIILHIGIPKTGTTAFQKFLWAKRDIFAHNGIIYNPEANKCHHLLSKAFMDGDSDYVNAVMCDIERYAGSECVYILSSEMLYIRPFHDFLKKAWKDGKVYKYCFSEYDDAMSAYIKSISSVFNGYDVDIVIFVRRQDDFVESFYRQMIKSYVRIDPLTFLNQIYPFIDYWGNISRWNRYFPTANIKVCSYETENGGTIAKFLALLGSSVPFDSAPGENHRLHRDVIEIKYCLNRVADALFSMNESRDLWKAISEYRDSDKKDTRIYSLEIRNAIMTQCADGNKLLSEKFLGGAQLFQELPVASEERSFPSLNFSEAAPYVMCALLKYIRKEHENDKRIRRLIDFMQNDGRFDEAFYRAEYLKGRKELYSPVEHYIRFGILKGYKPHN